MVFCVLCLPGNCWYAIMFNVGICRLSTGPSEKENFLFEISGFLTEYGCSYKSLVSGNVTKRLNNKIDCLKLICK